MSADNGIYILETLGPEFRVAYAGAIDNIYGDFDDVIAHWKGDKEQIKEYFKDAFKFNDLDEAVDKAQEMSDNYDYLEDGICLIKDFETLDFNQL